MKAIRGAIVVTENSEIGIQTATRELLDEITLRNHLKKSQIVSVFFSATADLNADFPARAARNVGWDVPMLDMQEMAVRGSLSHCLRVLIHVDDIDSVRHVYLGDARSLRPDLEEAQ